MKRLLIAVIIFLFILPFTPYLKKAYWAQEELQIHSEDRKNERVEESIKPKTQTGTVTGVPSGKSILVKKSDGNMEEIKILGIRLPEDECNKQKARKELMQMVGNSIVSMETDENGDCCTVRKNQQDIASLMLWNGYVRTDTGSTITKINEYSSKEYQAKAEKRGLWSGKCEN